MTEVELDPTLVLYEKDGPVARVIMNRPEKLNVLPHRATKLIADAVRQAEEDDEVKVIIIKGNGSSFCAGLEVADVGNMHGMAVPESGQRARRPPSRNVIMNDFLQGRDYDAILYSIKTTIAQVQGYCLGEGLGIVECCDFAVASSDAVFAIPQSRFGASGALPDTLPLILAAGPKRARELVQLGRRFSAEEAERFGIINRAVAPDELEAATMEYAQAVCALPRDGLALGKAYFHTILDLLGSSTARRAYIAAHGQVLGIRWGEDEYNFLKARRDSGVRGALQGLHNRFPPSLR